jgi:hypothetical protein
MNEEEWLACESPDRMIRWLREVAGARKLRLFACACCDCVAPLFPERWYCEVVEKARAYADALVSDEAMYRNYLRIKAEVDAKGGGDSAVKRMFSEARRAAYGAAKPDAGEAAWYAATCARDAIKIGHETDDPMIQIAFLRDIFGNPFRPVRFSPEWRTDTAVSLARQMYGSRDFGAMPILADALQDAGCDSEDVLSHCRDPKQVHVRGCWVVDLVLGKE